MRSPWAKAARRIASCLAMLLLFTGCSVKPVHGQAVPDWSAVETRSGELFDIQLEKLATYITGANPFATDAVTNVTGLSYVHMTYGELSSGSQSDVTIMGNPVSVLIKQTDADAGYTIDTLHVGGEKYDYLLLGDSYAALAAPVSPTPWVRTPTLYGGPGDDPLGLGLLTLCLVDGFRMVCRTHDAILHTAESDRGADMRKSVTANADGTLFSQTEVTLAACLEDPGMLGLPTDISSAFSQEMLDTFIPVSLWQDVDGRLVKMEMNGLIPGSGGADDFSLQVGFEITGTAVAEDFPPLPADWDVTILDTHQQVDDLYTQMGIS